MNGTGLGALEIQMLLDLIPLKKQMDEAKSLVGKGVSGMAGVMKGAMAGLAGALGVGMFASWIKGAIDAGDEAFNLSKKVGVPVKDLAGLQLAFKQAGVDSGAMQTALVKLSKGVAEGNDAFARLGINVRNADGSLKSSKQVLYDVADVFETMPDGINKTAEATFIFGKAGADLLPMLDGGSKGMREMAEMAEKLGLVIDDDAAAASDEFNDTLELLGLASQGVGRKVAAELLPTLKGLAGTMLDNVTSGDKLKFAADVLATGLKGLFTVGVVGVELFSTLGKTVGGVAGAVLAVAQGEFKQAWKILEESGRDITQGWSSSAKTISDAWTGAGATTVDQGLKINKALAGATAATKEQAEAAAKAAAEQAKLTKAGEDYLAGLGANLAAAQQQLATGRALSDGDKELLKLEQQLREGKMLLTEAQIASAKATIVETEAVRASAELKRELAKIEFEALQNGLKASDSVAQETAKQLEHNAAIGKTEAELRALEMARVDQRLAIAEQALQTKILTGVQGSEIEQYTLMVEELRGLKKAKEEGVVLELGQDAAKAAKEAAAEWGKVADQIGQGLTDSLFRAFESGKGFFSTLWSGITNLFKTTVLRLVMQPVQAGVTSLVAGAMGTPQSAYAGSGGMLSNASGLGSLYGLGSSAYSAASPYITSAYSYLTTGSAVGTSATNAALIESASGTAGYGASSASAASGAWGGTVGTGLGYAAGAAGGMIAGNYLSGGKGVLGNDSNFATGIGTAIGSFWGPWGAALGGAIGGLVNNLFGSRKDELLSRNISGTFSAGDFSGQGNANFHRGSGGYYWTSAELPTELAGAMDAGAKAVYEQAKAYGDALDLPVVQLRNVTKSITLDASMSAADMEAALRKSVNQYGDALVATWADALKGAKIGTETTLQTMERLGSSLLVVNQAFGNLGLGLLDASVAGGKAAANIVALTGGMDAFVTKTSSYLQNYLSEGEQSGLLAKGIRDQLAAAGLGGLLDNANDRGDLRALMEAANPATEAGQQQISALLNVAGEFAKLTEFMDKQGLTLAQLAGLAPASAALLDAGGRASTPAEPDRMQALAVSSNDRLGEIVTNSAGTVTQLQALVSTTVAANQALLARVEQLSAALEESTRPARLIDMQA